MFQHALELGYGVVLATEHLHRTYEDPGEIPVRILGGHPDAVQAQLVAPYLDPGLHAPGAHLQGNGEIQNVAVMAEAVYTERPPCVQIPFGQHGPLLAGGCIPDLHERGRRCGTEGAHVRGTTPSVYKCPSYPHAPRMTLRPSCWVF